ncbi:hypothetical protein [Limosilactobacillus panis]|uniref:Uncharacterized protein n=1 Tax=Limosilactobacillus panis TaxID=47493 RepID=A0ABT7VNW8_9LACO|nr:hypothetical protein [Limosilactobacillus panis]MDM8333831.1 hypothetical protein [Limosilactobacillus panis]HJA22106.1 hypothetical protein [Candidatus Limosilactobacillus intestinipullorum]
MPKQGHFAKSSRLKQLNNFKVKRPQVAGNEISGDQLTDFLVVRFALTAKKRVPAVAQETSQRFLIEVSDQLTNHQGNLSLIVPAVIRKLNPQVPWQFFQQLLANWALLQRFLVKELPAVPLNPRLRITEQVAVDELAQLVAHQLAIKGAATTLLNRPQVTPALKQRTTQLLLATLYQGGQVNWTQVRALLAPLPYQPPVELDASTREWLLDLSRQ